MPILPCNATETLTSMLSKANATSGRPLRMADSDSRFLLLSPNAVTAAGLTARTLVLREHVYLSMSGWSGVPPLLREHTLARHSPAAAALRMATGTTTIRHDMDSESLARCWRGRSSHCGTETSGIHLVLLGMQNRTFGPCLAGINGSTAAAMTWAVECWRRQSSQYVTESKASLIHWVQFSVLNRTFGLLSAELPRISQMQFINAILLVLFVSLCFRGQALAAIQRELAPEAGQRDANARAMPTSVRRRQCQSAHRLRQRASAGALVPPPRPRLRVAQQHRRAVACRRTEPSSRTPSRTRLGVELSHRRKAGRQAGRPRHLGESSQKGPCARNHPADTSTKSLIAWILSGTCTLYCDAWPCITEMNRIHLS
jgi:hypothetical protein